MSYIVVKTLRRDLLRGGTFETLEVFKDGSMKEALDKTFDSVKNILEVSAKGYADCNVELPKENES